MSGLEVLMVEEITTDALTLDEIDTNFEDRANNEIAVMATSIEEAAVEVNQFLGIETSPSVSKKRIFLLLIYSFQPKTRHSQCPCRNPALC